jgi:hypothetical protein
MQTNVIWAGVQRLLVMSVHTYALLHICTLTLCIYELYSDQGRNKDDRNWQMGQAEESDQIGSAHTTICLFVEMGSSIPA